MICAFCQQKLTVTQTLYDYDYDCISGHRYQCQACGIEFSANIRDERFPDGHIKCEWEEFDFWRVEDQEFRMECYLYPSPSCHILRKAKDYDPKNYGPIWEVLKFRFIPKNITARNLSERVKLWLLFS